MDETPATPSTTSSSAAAVADSASSVATTKLTKNAASVKSTVSSTTTSVKLLIKSSNQQYDDQVVESDLLWTVKRLKTHLSCVYPSKPPVADQKLIYSGQLLADTLLLKDVIRSYKDVYTYNHIIHLVYTPKHGLNPNSGQKAKAPVAGAAMSTTNAGSTGESAGFSGTRNNTAPNTYADGLRQRTQVTAEQLQQQLAAAQFQRMSRIAAAAHPCYNIPQMATVTGQPPQCSLPMPYAYGGQWPQMQAMASQQAHMYNWMQQVYAQYMDQCMRLSSEGANTAQTGGADLPPNYYPHMPYVPPIATHLGSGGGVGPINPVIQFQSAPISVASFLVQPPEQATAAAPAPQNIAIQQQPQPQAQQPQQQQQAVVPQQQQQVRRFPNIVQDEQDHRDWLDNFLSIMRLAIFLTLLYFNSSPLRCLVVVIIAGLFYLYHIGAIRVRPEHNNNNINRDNNQIRQGVQQVQQAQAAQQQQEQPAANPPIVDVEPAAHPDGPGDEVNAAAVADSGNNADNGAAIVEVENRSTSVISFLRTFVVTFFTSLLPETPAL